MVGIATIPRREQSLERTIASIAPQADRIFVSLNDYRSPPVWLGGYPNVTATVRRRNGGDAEKFAAIDDWGGFVVTCDDDLLYPPDYIATLLAGIDRHGRHHAAGFHGGKTLGFNGRPVAATHKQIRCLGDLAHDDLDVNVLGTGAMGFHTAHVPVWRDVFRHPNMADVHLACHARAFGIPMVALAHQAGWLKDIGDGPGIYESNRGRDGSARDTTVQREHEMNRHDWKTPPSRPRVRVSIATCDRPHLLPGLLDDLEREAGWADLDVAIYEDPSLGDYTAARAQAARNGWYWHRFERRLGKQLHSQLVNQQLHDCRTARADWFVFLPDDVRLVRHAIPRAIATWARLDDPATLTLWRLKDHEGKPNWTGLVPVDRGEAWEVFHVDGIYLCRRETLKALGFQCPSIPVRRRRRATSSGVGRTMSLTLHAAGRRMYRVSRSLAVPVPDEPSVMNPDCNDRVDEWVAL